jgi:hypothetical protein
MTQQHSITPPLKLMNQLWEDRYSQRIEINVDYVLATAPGGMVSRWGADQELEACCEWSHTVHCIGA